MIEDILKRIALNTEKRVAEYKEKVPLEEMKAKALALPAETAAKFTRSLPKEFIAKNGHDVTPAFLEYAKPLVGELPFCETF